MKILIAVPCMESLPVAFVRSLIALDQPEGAEIDVKFHSGSLVYDARNLICIYAFERGYDYVMWFDSDMTFARDTLKRLMCVMETRSASMVSGVYVKRTFPTDPVIFKTMNPPALHEDGKYRADMEPYSDFPERSVFPIAACGFGCVLTPVPLLKDVWDHFGPAFTPMQYFGEDMSFCYRVNNLPGHETSILCDSNVLCGHIGSFLYTTDILKRGDNNHA